MTAVQPPAPNEPPPPQRGQTLEERGRDISEAQAEAEAETSKVKQYLKIMSPRYRVVDGRRVPGGAQAVHPVLPDPHLSGLGVRLLAGAVFHALFYVTVYPVLWLLFWPVRAHQKKHHPEEYAANRAKYKKKK